MDDLNDTQVHGSRLLAEPPPADPRGVRPTYLIVVGGGVPGSMLPLSAGGTRLGRSTSNDVRVPDLAVSRNHASIHFDDRGRAWLTDLGSTNGTFLGNRRLTPHQAARLDDGDRIQLGSSFVVKFVGLDPSEERFQREMFERTVRDPLTGLYNRRYFLEQLGGVAASGAAQGLGLAVLMIDVDHFKAINDTHGHDAGDVALRQVAQVLRDCTRGDDLVARHGGEEFILALTVKAPDQATERAERIRGAIAGRVFEIDSRPLRVTVSIGLAFSHAARIRQPAGLIAAADQGLYQAKRSGRDRVVFHAEVVPFQESGPDPSAHTSSKS